MPSQRSALTPFQSKCGGPRLGLSLALKLTARKDKIQWCSCYTDQQLTTTVSTLSLYLSIHATLRERSRLGQGDKVGKGKSVIKTFRASFNVRNVHIFWYIHVQRSIQRLYGARTGRGPCYLTDFP